MNDAKTTYQILPIYVNNFVFGLAHLLHFTLPPAWQLRRGFAHPEIHATHERHGHVWIAAADAWYILAHQEEPWLLEMHLHVQPSPPRMAEGEEWGPIARHPAVLSRRTVRRGPPWRRRDTPQWTLSWYCPETERGFQLQITGRVPEEAVQDLLRAWRYLHCHPRAEQDETS
ncbi:MAG: hypothetical protein GXO54_06405 [Chloroflexi bacterium]|nr:hypothetical protein [Chloroflexota bacterium]